MEEITNPEEVNEFSKNNPEFTKIIQCINFAHLKISKYCCMFKIIAGENESP